MSATRRSTPTGKPNLSRNLSNIKKVQVNGSRSNVMLASLRATQIVGYKPVLPAELIATILDYLPVPDLLRFAQVSRRLQEMVYDDTRWIQRLKAMGIWNDGEARQRFEEGLRRKAEAQRAREAEEARRTGANLPGSVHGMAGGGRPHAGSTTLFDAAVEGDIYRKSLEKPPVRRRGTLADGFDETTLSPSSTLSGDRAPWDATAALNVLSTVRSVRGRARQEFGKVYGSLGPLYLDLARSKGLSDPIIFRTYRDPEQQAQVLSQLKTFALCDHTYGWQQREEKLDTLIGIFENAVLREFEQGYQANDVDGSMKRYAHVLVTLNGGMAVIDAFIQNHPVMTRKERIGNPLSCLEAVAPGHVDLNPSQHFFERLATIAVEQASIIVRVFPATVNVLLPLLSRLGEDIISEYLTTLFDEAHKISLETYVKAVAGTFEQALRFVASVKLVDASPNSDVADEAKAIVTRCYEPHIDLYLTEELDLFKTKSEAEVGRWEKEMSEQEASTESFFMSNINRQAAKRDFLTSFKKVVMMPVHVLPAFPLSSPFATAKPAVAPVRSLATIDIAQSSRPPTPTLTWSNTTNRVSTPQPPGEAPTTELAAKTAIMNSRLEGIKSLFSIEVALSLIHSAKASLERAGLLVQIGGRLGDGAKEQCEAIFVMLLSTLGQRHVRHGFDKAVDHLTNYNPQEVKQFRKQTANGDGSNTVEGRKAVGLEPLVTFLELVNVGDLIQQMIDVFYAQELVATKLTDRDDFLDPAVKEKKKFEQMLDERVAAGLNKGIDVLMGEVEYICSTTQLTTDFNPGADKEGRNGMPHGLMDIGPTNTAQQVVDTVSGHTSMLVGSTDKNMLDVFNQEVGLRLYSVLCKHFKRQRISVDGAIKFISDINHYSAFIGTLRQKPLVPYFTALREVAQIYLVEVQRPASFFPNAIGSRNSVQATKKSTSRNQARELATIIADTERYCGIFSAEEVCEFAERRADWYVVRGDVEKAMYGIGCALM